MYDIFYISDQKDEGFNQLLSKYPSARLVKTIQEAKRRSLTRMYWIVWGELKLCDDFKFDYMVNSWDRDLVHCFKNTNGSLGVSLIPRKIDVTDRNAVFNNTNVIIDIRASTLANYSLDVVYISNGEPCAEDNWDRLNRLLDGKPNKLHRIDGVNGRTAAYQAAARISTTRAFFAVFAKLQVSQDFDWNWTCGQYEDRHYVFMAENPVNGLIYGHQAIIAYNKKLVLANPGNEIDFTMAQPYQEVDLLSGIAQFNTSPKHSWRTAFREALKLKLYSDTRDDRMADSRLMRWLTIGNEQWGAWSIAGAQDAVEYYRVVEGNHSKLQLSFEWKWLDDFYFAKYSLTDCIT